jgi:hypothetical protein
VAWRSRSAIGVEDFPNGVAKPGNRGQKPKRKPNPGTERWPRSRTRSRTKEPNAGIRSHQTGVGPTAEVQPASGGVVSCLGFPVCFRLRHARPRRFFRPWFPGFFRPAPACRVAEGGKNVGTRSWKAGHHLAPRAAVAEPWLCGFVRVRCRTPAGELTGIVRPKTCQNLSFRSPRGGPSARRPRAFTGFEGVGGGRFSTGRPGADHWPAAWARLRNSGRGVLARKTRATAVKDGSQRLLGVIPRRSERNGQEQAL